MKNCKRSHQSPCNSKHSSNQIRSTGGNHCKFLKSKVSNRARLCDDRARFVVAPLAWRHSFHWCSKKARLQNRNGNKVKTRTICQLIWMGLMNRKKLRSSILKRRIAVRRCRVQRKRIIWGRERSWVCWRVVCRRWFRSRLMLWHRMWKHSSLPWTKPSKSWRTESQNSKSQNPNQKLNLQTPN